MAEKNTEKTIKKTTEKGKENRKRKYSRAGCLVWAAGKLWRLDKWFVFWGLAAFAPSILYSLTEAYFPKELIDLIGAGADFGRLAAVSAGYIGALFFLRLSIDFISSKRHGKNYYPTIIYQCEMDIWENYEADYESTFGQEFRKIGGYAHGDACGGNCAMEYFWKDCTDAIYSLAGIVTYASLLTVLNPLLLAVTAFTSLTSWFTTRWRPRYYEKNKHKWEKECRKRNYLQELSGDFSLAKDIKLYGLENWLERMMRGYQDFILGWNRKCSLRELWARLIYWLMNLLQSGAAYFVLIATLINGTITVGEFVLYFNLVLQLGEFFENIISQAAKLSTRGEKIAYYREFFDYPRHFHHGKGCELPAGPVTIELRDVWYRYDGAEEDILKGIDLTIKAGEKLALVGINGAGKTTLIKLICGLFRPSRGEILVNGKNIQEYNIEEYYSLISAVFQEIRPIAFTIFEFVASVDLGRPNAREEAVRAMKAAGIYEKVQKLPGGMDTHLMKGVYDDGVDFSGGEMQKLVLARAIYKDSVILVLDEPTAALDPIAENKLYLQYRELTEGKTSIYISHRFASTRFCDRIVLLEDGVIKEMGSHEELMERKGRYAYMFGVQSKYYKESRRINTAEQG